MTIPIEPGPDAPRLRARARAGAGTALRPEIADALGGLERSIGDVAEWEQLLAGAPADPSGTDAATGTSPAPAAVDLVLVGHVVPQAAEEADDVEADALVEDTGPGLGVAAAVAGGPDAPPEPDLDLGPLFAQPAPEYDALAAWVDTTGSPHRFGPSPEEVRRRRNGRILSWGGALLAVGVVAFLVIPDHSGSRPTLVKDSTTSTSTSTTLARTALNGPDLPTIPDTTPSTVAPAQPTTATTVRRRTTTPTVTTTTLAFVITPTPTTPTTQPPPPTTQPPPPPTTTCTTIAGDEYDPIRGC